jgi:hypothetical protein
VAVGGRPPVWVWPAEEAPLTLSASAPSTAVLYLALWDAGGAGGAAFLAYAAVPLPALRLGYRSAQLRDASGKKIHLASLLMRLERREPNK